MGYIDRFTAGVLDPGYEIVSGVVTSVGGGALRSSDVTLRRAEPVLGRVTIGFEQTYVGIAGASFYVMVGVASRLDGGNGQWADFASVGDSRPESAARMFVGDSEASAPPNATLNFYGDALATPGVPLFEDHDDVSGPWAFGTISGEIPFARVEQGWLTVEYNATDGRIYGGLWTSEPPANGGTADFVWASSPRQVDPTGDMFMQVQFADLGGSDPRLTLWRNADPAAPPALWAPPWPYEDPTIAASLGDRGVMRF